jgi:hypothetical protein
VSQPTGSVVHGSSNILRHAHCHRLYHIRKQQVKRREGFGHDFSQTHINRDYLLMTALPGTPPSEVPGLTRAHAITAMLGLIVYQVTLIIASQSFTRDWSGHGPE